MWLDKPIHKWFEMKLYQNEQNKVVEIRCSATFLMDSALFLNFTSVFTFSFNRWNSH